MIPLATSLSPTATPLSLLPMHAPTSLQKHLLSESPTVNKLKQAAGEFEAMLLSNLWKSMKSTFDDPDDESDDPAHETLSDMGIQAMAGAVGKAGGLGLGKLIVKHLEPLLAHSQHGNSDPLASKASSVPADTFLERR